MAAKCPLKSIVCLILQEFATKKRVSIYSLITTSCFSAHLRCFINTVFKSFVQHSRELRECTKFDRRAPNKHSLYKCLKELGKKPQ